MSDTANSGCHCNRHNSWKVPCWRLEPRSALPQAMPSKFSRCNRRLRSRSVGARRSKSSTRCVASGGRRRRFCSRVRSCASGTIGVFSGTVPRRSLTMSFSSISRKGSGSPKHRTVWVASFNSGRPGRGRPRNAAMVSARRTASMTLAEDASRSSARSRWATLASHRVAMLVDAGCVVRDSPRRRVVTAGA